MAAWSPGQYTKFEDERSRPAADLLARVPLAAPRRVVDIGCGPGNSTELLIARFPAAEVLGLDSSPEMLAAARKRLPRTALIEADVASWTPSPPADLLFSNAAFHWVAGHAAVLRRLMGTLPAGGALALQVPDNLAEPSHILMREVAASGPWREKFAEPVAREEILAAPGYYDLLRPLAGRIDIWRTEYNHPLADAAAIVEWVRGTGLRPYLDRLAPTESEAYVAEYRSRLAEAYPPLVDGRVMLRFPRLFVVATKA
jgi:trans-aconitate 2-methyltransferase